MAASGGHWAKSPGSSPRFVAPFEDDFTKMQRNARTVARDARTERRELLMAEREWRRQVAQPTPDGALPRNLSYGSRTDYENEKPNAGRERSRRLRAVERRARQIVSGQRSWLGD
ncbi:MAG: hypothetical protein GX597_13715 [Anaerolineaceae bacterium]|nr:hypothetical protein [Anaerolineaceae bacterium]